MVWSAMLKLDNTKSSETSRRSIPKLVLLVANNENWISKEVRFPEEEAFGCWEYWKHRFWKILKKNFTSQDDVEIFGEPDIDAE